MLGRVIWSSNLLIRPVLLNCAKKTIRNVNVSGIICKPVTNNFSTLATRNVTLNRPKLLLDPKIQSIANNITPVRTVTKFSIRKGRRKTVKAVLRRFYRLWWGGWIRTKCGRRKKLWKKSSARKRRLRQHVLCNSTQCTLLDKMVGSYWRRPKYYVDDPYEPYHVRDEHPFARKTPRPYFPPED